MNTKIAGIEKQATHISSLATSLCTASTPIDDGYFSRNASSTTEANSTIDSCPVEIIKPKNITKVTSTTESNKQKENGDYNSNRENHEIQNCILEIDKWDKINKTVEKFSQNTVTLLSWINEFEETSTNSVDTSPVFYESQFGRKSSIKNHIERVLQLVRQDASMLMHAIPSEKVTVYNVLKNLETRCCNLDKHCNNQTALKNPFVVKSNDLVEKESPERPLIKSTNTSLSALDEIKPRISLISYLNAYEKSKHRIPNCGKIIEYPPALLPPISRRSLSLRMNWIDFLREYDAIIDWLYKMDALITKAEKSDIPLASLQNLFKTYHHQFVTARPKKAIFSLKANYIGTMFPEMRNGSERKLIEVEDIWIGLRLRLSNYLTFLLNDEEQHQESGFLQGKAEKAHCMKSFTNERHSTSSNLELNDSSSHINLDNLSSGNVNRETEVHRQKQKSLANEIDHCRRILDDIESEAYRKENSVKIGWNPVRLKELLAVNKEHRLKLNEIEDQLKLIENDNSSNNNIKNADELEISNKWSMLMLNQCYSNLSLFTLDMECVLEERIKLLEKDSFDVNSRHSFGESSTEKE